MRQAYKKLLFVLEFGLGDAIKSIHYVNQLFDRDTDNYILHVSYRMEFVREFLELVKPYLPPFQIIEGGELLNLNHRPVRLDIAEVYRRYPGYEIHNLMYGEDPSVYVNDYLWLEKKPFDYSKVQYSSDLKLDNFSVFSVDVLRKDRVVNAEFWKATEKEWLRSGTAVVLIGKEPENQVDDFVRPNIHYQPEPETLDLRNKTNIHDLFYLVKNCNEAVFPCNGLAVLAYELGAKCRTFGNFEVKYSYDYRFFHREKEGFHLLDVNDYR